MARRIRNPESSLICVDKNGRVGIIGEMAPGAARFFVFDKEGNTGKPISVPYEELTQASQHEIPVSRRLPDALAMEAGYLDDPSYDPNAKPAPVVVAEEQQPE